MKKKLTFLFFLLPAIMFCQIHKYKYGCEGIETIGAIGDSIIIYSQSKAKCEIKKEVADTIVLLYSKKRIKQKRLIIFTKKSKVTGFLKVERKNKTIHLLFIYENIQWKDSITETPVYKNNF